ncbi:IS3 family transposase [Candidatus Poriferisocius sp.]|uniref:IS3 family transposase n=1 Tax=Candidatus Poriferisocius sp. TaxID=3101276 RepID=UPI003B026980
MTEQRRRGKYPDEMRERVVRMVFEAQRGCGSQWEAVSSVAEKLGPTPETVRNQVRRMEIDAGRQLASARSKRDEALKVEIARVHAENFGGYGAPKVWAQLNREWHWVACCTVERLMRDLGLRGVTRGKLRRTTVADTAAERPRDLAERRFSARPPRTDCGLALQRQAGHGAPRSVAAGAISGRASPARRRTPRGVRGSACAPQPCLADGLHLLRDRRRGHLAAVPGGGLRHQGRAGLPDHTHPGRHRPHRRPPE